jgi:excisionase family DNA binding protein
MEMTAGGNDIAALVAALKEHTRAIGSLVATLAPPVPDLVGTDYIARRLGVSKQWVGAMAERGDIPRHCVAPKVSGGRIWKFHRDKIEAWLRDREEG